GRSQSVAIWRFPPGEAEVVKVSVGLPWAARAYGAVGDGSWWNSWGLALILSEVLFIPVLFYLFRRGVLTRSEAGLRTFGHQLLWLGGAARLAVAAAVAVLLRDAFDFFDWAPAARVAIEALPSLIGVFCFAAIYLASQPPGSWRRVFSIAALIDLSFLGV